mmetsp:Transcript_121399/g.259207  ORF Transcript_121399/g.259207 Transcript_121399/m.259207 type:complete len:417 (-) Transcript_121399:50-1300(-)
MGISLSCPRCFEGVLGRNSVPAELRDAAIEGFATAFQGVRPTALGVAPGRAEVLGNHTDYNEGYILSCAIDRYVVVSGRKIDGTVCRLVSSSYPGVTVQFSMDTLEKQHGKDSSWANYVIGVVSELGKQGSVVGGFEAYVHSNLPHGAGVSSSAALEMATAKLLALLFPSSVGRMDDIALVKVAKAAENNFVGMGCGILDQFSSGKGRGGQLLYLDCRTLDFGYAPFRGAQFVLANTHAPHQLVDGKYDELRRHCFAAAEALKQATGDAKITHLRDVDTATFDRHASSMPEAQRKRAKHIVFENERVKKGIQALKANDMATMGALMSGSHSSSRDDFGNSCPQLDVMAELAEGIDGFLGARLMGGGFGGSTINLVKEGTAESFSAELSRRYQQKTGVTPTVLVCVPGAGAFGEPVS